MTTNETPMPGAGEPASPDPDLAAAARSALERVVSSEGFRGAPQLVAFLSFIVERALEGRGGELKGYTIATEALGRPAEFDPQADPIVRVEAGRLRRALMQYYAVEGAQDPIRISVPLGAYVPHFEPVGAATATEDGVEDTPAADAPATPPLPAGDGRHAVEPRELSRRWLLLVALAVLLAAMFAAYRFWPARMPGQLERQDAAREQGAAVNLPVIAIATGSATSDPVLADTVASFARHLVDSLARFDDLVIVRTPAPGENVTAGADYVLELNVEKVGQDIEGLGSLRATGDGRIVWTSSMQRARTAGSFDPELAEVARRLAVRLAEPFGIVQADFRTLTQSSAVRCLHVGYAYRRNMQRADLAAARACLEKVVSSEPRFHPASSQLALVLVDAHALGANPDGPRALDRALAAADTAIQLAPASARAMQALMRVHFARGASDEALRIGREAMARNPVDVDILADLGARYVLLGRPVNGLPLLGRALDLPGGRLPTHDFYAYIGAYLLGAEDLMEQRSTALVVDGNPYSLLATALHQARHGNRDASLVALRRLSQLLPAFAADPAGVLTRQGFVGPAVERILQGLGTEALEAIR